MTGLRRERDRIDRAVADLLAARSVLDVIIGAAPPPDAAGPDACRAA
ncbi:hypothetical protein [Nocardia sp. IFM 10818]